MKKPDPQIPQQEAIQGGQKVVDQTKQGDKGGNFQQKIFPQHGHNFIARKDMNYFSFFNETTEFFYNLISKKLN